MANTNFFIFSCQKRTGMRLALTRVRFLKEGIHCLDKSNMISLCYKQQQLLTELPGGDIWHRTIESM